jgi:hypothetical protein
VSSSQFKKIKSLWIISIISSISLITSVSVIAVNSQTIFLESPRIGIPSILTQGDTLSIEILWPMGLNTQGIQIFLESEFNSELFEIFSVVVDKLTKKIFEITIPESFPLGLYDLRISCGRFEDIERHSVCVINEYPNNIEFAHITDIHINPDRPELISNWREAVKELNLLNPDFLLITGDIVDLSRTLEWDIFEEILLLATFPTVIVLGNHDMQSSNEYYQRFAQFNFGFDYGPNFHFTNFHTGGQSSGSPHIYSTKQFIENNLRDHEDVPVKFLVSHIPIPDRDFKTPFGENSDWLYDLILEYEIDASFAGHHHDDSIYDYNGYQISQFPSSSPVFIETRSLGKGVDWSKFRWIKANSTHGITSCFYNNDGIPGGLDSVPLYNISISKIYFNSSILNPSNVTIRIQNDLHQSFAGCQVHITVSGTNSSSYQTDYGLIVEVNEIGSGDGYDILIEFDLPENSTTEINVMQG